MIDASFYTLLDSVVGVSVFAGPLPHNAAPAVNFTRADGDYDQVHGGSVSSLQAVEFDVDCWSTTYLDARTTADTVIAALVGYRATVGAHRIDNILLERDISVHETETKLHRAALTFRVFYDV